MHELLKRIASLVTALVIVGMTALGAAAQDDGSDEVPLSVPLPEECVVEPRDEAEIDEILQSGDHQFVLPEGLPVPLGEPADQDTQFAVAETVYELIACLNAGDAQRAATLFSENGLRAFYGLAATDSSVGEQAPEGTPTPRTENQWLRLRAVTDIAMLEEGRAAAFVIVDDPLLRGRAQTLLFVFVNEGGVWLIDGTVGFSAIAPVATPTP